MRVCIYLCFLSVLNGMRDNLDLLILGGYYGEGRRRSGAISHFLLGVTEPRDASKADSDSKAPRRYYTFCKVGSGYTDADLAHLNSTLKWKDFIPNNPPPHLMVRKQSKQSVSRYRKERRRPS